MVGGRGRVWDSDPRSGRERCSLPPPPPLTSTSCEWKEDLGLRQVGHHTAGPQDWGGGTYRESDTPGQVYSQVHSRDPQTWEP